VTTDDLDAQVKREAAELAAAPAVPSAGTVARCHWCGRVIVGEPTRVESIGSAERFKGECCRAKP
jgi:hypothetical protein